MQDEVGLRAVSTEGRGGAKGIPQGIQEVGLWSRIMRTAEMASTTLLKVIWDERTKQKICGVSGYDGGSLLSDETE